MNRSPYPSLLSGVPRVPRDPILGLTELFNADPNLRKVNLGVGVYADDAGQVPVLACVREAEQRFARTSAPHTYLPIDGLPAYDQAVQAFVFGAHSEARLENRIVTVQTPGGTGALKVGADFLRRFAPDAQVWISEPSWENHRALFEGAGFIVNTYPYYDASTRGLDFKAMLDAINTMPPGSIVVLHACCHNPTGVDLDFDQWTQVISAVRGRRLTPFLDLAYQGFGEGIDADAGAVRRFADSGAPVLVAHSLSKSLSLYGERIGTLSLVADSTEEAERVLTQLKRTVRTSYSSPPSYGSKLATTVFTTPELRVLWETELDAMRDRIRDVRRQWVERLRARAPRHDFDFVLKQCGMFSYSGLGRDHVTRLREQYSIYAVDTGRICMAALNSTNIDYVVDSIASVVG